jgi:superfamily II DNA/RNA helicase
VELALQNKQETLKEERTNYCVPGRMQDMINIVSKHTQINYCILDEADEMLNMGFYDDIVNILSTTPDEKTHVFCNNAC